MPSLSLTNLHSTLSLCGERRQNGKMRTHVESSGWLAGWRTNWKCICSFLPSFFLFFHSHTAKAIVWQRQKICDNDDEGERIECWELNAAATAAAGSNAAWMQMVRFSTSSAWCIDRQKIFVCLRAKRGTWHTHTTRLGHKFAKQKSQDLGLFLGRF